MAQFEKLTAPSKGTAIRFENGQPVVADNPIIPFIRVMALAWTSGLRHKKC